MPLPQTLLAAVAHEVGGRLVLVVGAGCSHEAPTDLPLARDCAQAVHDRLVADLIIPKDACSNPDDLSAVADATRQCTGSQAPLVERLPLVRLKNAEPNRGHLLAAAMLRECAIRAILTLNFDLALSTALAQLGSKDVTTLAGPQDHHRMGSFNLVYLHRNVDADPESWILCTDSIHQAWVDSWERVISEALLSAPVTVFAGLGTPAKALVESSKRIRGAAPAGVTIFQVDPGEFGSSQFTKQLQISEANYIRLGWLDFMDQLAARLTKEHRQDTERACKTIAQDDRLNPEDATSLLNQLEDLGLLAVGTLRARWLLEPTSYYPHRSLDPRYLANLLLALALIERVTGTTVRLDTDGFAHLFSGPSHKATVRLAHGRGLAAWIAFETKLRKLKDLSSPGKNASTAVVAGVTPPPVEISPPLDIVGEGDGHDIVGGLQPLKILTVEELRSDPSNAMELLQ